MASNVPTATSTRSLRTIPAGRHGDPAELAAVVAILASDRASYVTGSFVAVTGGQLPGI